MPNLETPEQFARRIGKSLPPCDLNSRMAHRAIEEAIRARDRQVREAALLEAADLLSTDGNDDVGSVKLERGSKADRTTWMLSRLSCAARIRALTTGAPDDR